MTKVDKDTQTREYYENLEKARRREKLETDTDKIKRGTGESLFEFGVLEIRATVERIAQSIDKFRERQEEVIEAEWQSLSARANTLKTKTNSK